MTFENHTRGERDHGTPKDATENKELNNDLRAGQNAKSFVDFAGGQPKNDPGGLDMSQYTGPDSKGSSQLNAPEAPFKTGPGNGLSNQEQDYQGDWENPEPENDSF